MFFTWVVTLAAIVLLMLIVGYSLWLTHRETREQRDSSRGGAGPRTDGHIEHPRAA